MRNLRSIVILILLASYSNMSTAQSETTLESLIKSLSIDSTKASNDIIENKIILYLPGSIGCPSLSIKDKETMKKYNFLYTCQGCIRLESDDVPKYNKLMKEYLVNKYGETIIYELRLDVIKQ